MGRAKHDWDAVREQYVRANTIGVALGEEALTLIELSRRAGIPYGTLRNRASRENWDRVVAAGRVEIERVAEAREKALVERLKATLEVEEIEVRRRHLMIAQLAQTKAVARLSEIPDNGGDMSVRDAIRLVRLGIEEERRALGIVTTKPLSGSLDDETDDDLTGDGALEAVAEVVRVLEDKMKEEET